MDEVLAHPFFSGLDFKRILSKNLISPLSTLRKESESDLIADIDEERKSDNSQDDDSVHESVIPEEIDEIIRLN